MLWFLQCLEERDSEKKLNFRRPFSVNKTASSNEVHVIVATNQLIFKNMNSELLIIFNNLTGPAMEMS